MTGSKSNKYPVNWLCVWSTGTTKGSSTEISNVSSNRLILKISSYFFSIYSSCLSRIALNILRVGLSLKLIDLDCAVIYREGATAGSKYSSAYIPPEMLWQRSDGSFAVRIGSSRVNHVPASPSLDMWALGCVLYLLCSGSTLFQCTVQDHISNQSDFEVLYRWSDDTKKKKLDLIENKLARNMVSMLLNKDPEKRLSASRLLQHPFFTGKSGARMMGDAATWDVFISYRVESDLDIASLIYDKLTACGLRVWWIRGVYCPDRIGRLDSAVGWLTARIWSAFYLEAE